MVRIFNQGFDQVMANAATRTSDKDTHENFLGKGSIILTLKSPERVTALGQFKTRILAGLGHLINIAIGLSNLDQQRLNHLLLRVKSLLRVHSVFPSFV